MTNKIKCFFFFCLFAPVSTWSQSTYLPLNDIPYHWLDRFDVLFNNPSNLHFSVKGIARKDIAHLVLTIDSLHPNLSKLDYGDLQWLINQNNEWYIDKDQQLYSEQYIDSSQTFYTYNANIQSGLKPQRSQKPFLKHFYTTPAHMFEINSPEFTLRINPLLNFRLAKEKDDEFLLFENQRGISIRGSIDDKVYFHTEVLESQARYPNYVSTFRSKFNAVPGAGFYKTYRSSVFNFNNGVDYLLANAYVGTSISKHVQIELGHGRHFIGNGIRSLLLSDFTTDYFYLKLNTRVWRFHYENIFGELLQGRRERGDQLLPKKYFAAHYLSLKILQNLYVGLFETVVFAREDQFELQYLNPVILYRTVEGSIGSPDNVLIGIDLKYNLWRRISLYSQFVLDEFKFSEIKARNGWWANKYGLQVGSKVFDLFRISHLDLQLEYNVVRPYTYSHRSVAHYSHYSQGLAHPLGANFRESILRITYQPSDRWFFILRALKMKTGEDQDTLNWGSNILLSNDEGRFSDHGNFISQGVQTDITTVGVDLNYQLKHGLFFDVFYQYRKKESGLNDRDQSSSYIGAGFRWNLGRKWIEF